jgi:hypothetical protein
MTPKKKLTAATLASMTRALRLSPINPLQKPRVAKWLLNVHLPKNSRYEPTSPHFYIFILAQIWVNGVMVSRFIRYLVTLTVLLTTMVASLPVMLCVSDIHGAAIEVVRHHANPDDSSDTGHARLGDAKFLSDQEPCIDIQFDRAAFGSQGRDRQSISSVCASNGSVSFIAIASASNFLFQTFTLAIAAHPAKHDALRSSLSDLKTIVLLI